MTEIESNVPRPERKTKRQRHDAYPWKELEVGQSFLMREGAYYQLAYAQCRQANGTHSPKKFDFAEMEDGRYRCWRVE